MQPERIPLISRQNVVVGYALVDAELFDELSALRWVLGRNGYASRNGRELPGPGARVFMHRHIMGLSPGDGFHTDHINGDKLDNRRENLRVTTCSENLQNRRHGYGTSRFRGVAWDKRRGNWTAQACLDGRKYYLGAFDDEIAAARAADRWRLEHMPCAQPDAALTEIQEVAAWTAGSSRP